MIFILQKLSTFVTYYMLEILITSKTRLRLIIKFFLNIANKGYLNSLANEFGESTNSVRKELNNLSSAGYLEGQCFTPIIQDYSKNSKKTFGYRRNYRNCFK